MLTAIKFIVLMSALTGIIYPLSMTGISQFLFSHTASGSLIKKDSKVIGSELVAQKFTQEKYFWPRPSAVDYNPMSSGASNLGPISSVLSETINERSQNGAAFEMLFASGSGLDPHISLNGAKSQLARIAKARGVKEEVLNKLINDYTEQRQFRVLGEVRVNVLKLNLALDELR